jgi:hypothetical protein
MQFRLTMTAPPNLTRQATFDAAQAPKGFNVQPNSAPAGTFRVATNSGQVVDPACPFIPASFQCEAA